MNVDEILNPLGGAGMRPFALGGDQRQVKSAHFPRRLRFACRASFGGGQNAKTTRPFGPPLDGVCRGVFTVLPASARGFGGSAGALPPEHLTLAGAS